jgi:iron complex transport system substrate-binding protein
MNPSTGCEGYIFEKKKERKMRSRLSKIGLICLVAILFSGLFVSCSSEPETTTPSANTITDQVGRTVTLETTDPQRIVSLAPANTEILFALGLGDKVVGVTDYSDYPPEATLKPNVGRYDTPNIEQILTADPDLILADSIHKAEIIPQLESHGLTVVTIAPATFEDIFDSIRMVGEITGTEEKADKLLSDMQARVEAITEKTTALPESEIVSVFYLVWHDPLMTSGGDTLINEMIEMSGGRNLFEDVSGAAIVELEELIARNPQVIIVGVGMGIDVEITMQVFETESRLMNTDAMKNGRVYGIHLDISGRTGPRIVEGLEAFARSIHPELFE